MTVIPPDPVQVTIANARHKHRKYLERRGVDMLVEPRHGATMDYDLQERAALVTCDACDFFFWRAW